jgi:hypothetical protein
VTIDPKVTTDTITVSHPVIGDDVCKSLSSEEYEHYTELQTVQNIVSALRTVFFDKYEEQLKQKRRDHPCQHYRLRYFNILKAYYMLLYSFKIEKSDNDEEVWLEMLKQYDESKFDTVYKAFASIVRVNACSNGNKLKDMVEEFMQHMIANVWVPRVP